MATVASGNIDGYYESGIHAWDIAAGALIVTEAGGVVMDTSGSNHSCYLYIYIYIYMMCASAYSLLHSFAQ